MLHNEPLLGGYVTSKDPDSLEPGELQDGLNYWYVSAVDDLIEGPAFATATMSSSSYCYGLAPANFDNGNGYLLSLLGTKFQYSAITGNNGVLGTWTDFGSTFASSSARNSFNAVHYNNKYYLFDGIQANNVLRSDLTVRSHGLAPVITALPSVTSASATANVWPANATGYFDYWYTEVMKLSGNPEDIVIESSYEATTTDSNLTGSASVGQNVSGPNGEAAKIVLASIVVTGLNTTVTVKIPINPRNTGTTHYRLYRSEAKEASTDTSFPIGELIAEPKIPGSTSTGEADQFITIIDGATQTSSYVYPTAIATATGWSTTANGIDGSGHYSDGTFMTATIGLPSTTGGNTATFSVKTWNAGAAITADPISALEVAVRGKVVASIGGLNGGSVQAQVSFDGGSSWSGYVSLGEFTSTAAELTSGMRNWGRTSISREDLLDANFYVRISVTMTARTSTPRTSIVSIDGVRVRANFNGTAGIQTSPYPGIVVTVGKQSYVCSRNGQPPIAKTGCIFQGSLVTNEAGNPSNLRWSIPGDPEAFPTLYYLPIETPNNDSITFIGMVNNVCVVGLQNSIVRLNYLPTEDDASFTRTRIYDYISKSLGILSPRAACTFLSPDGRELLACVTQDGVYVTDGFTMSKWDQDYTFGRSIMNVLVQFNSSRYDPRSLQIVNDISSGNLMLTYMNQTFGTTVVLPLSYTARHIKPGPRFKLGLPLVGPSTTAGLAITSFTTTGGLPVTYLATNTSTSTANITSLINLGILNYSVVTSVVPFISTRRMQFVEGFDDVIVQGVYLHGTTHSVRAISYLLDEVGSTSSSIVNFTSSVISKADLSFNGYQTYFTLFATGDESVPSQLNRIIIDYDRLS